MSYFIGIDIGASFIKGAVIDLEKLRVKNVTKYPAPTPTSPLSLSNNKANLRFEIHCDLYEKIVLKIIKELLLGEKKIEGIVFSTQMHGMVLVDTQCNQLTPFIGWQDERLLEKAQKNQTWLDLLNKKVKKVDLSKTGITFRSGLMGSTLFWLHENRILKKHKDGKALFLGDYIAAKLTGGVMVAHSTNACGSALFDVKKNTWDEKIINALGIDKSFLPEVVPTGTKVGEFLHNKKYIPVFVSVGDMQTAILGSFVGLKKDREICVNIGTGSQVSVIAENFRLGNYDIRSYFDGMYLNTVTFIPAGRALNVIIHFIEDIGHIFFHSKGGDVWEKLIVLLANKKTRSGLTANLSFFKNSVSQDVGGSFSQITERNFTIQNIFLSALETMCENYWIAYNRLGKLKITDNIICTGGLVRKLNHLRILLQEKFKRKIALAPYEEETLVGLLILSLFIRGKFATLKDASRFVQKHKVKFIT